MSIGAPANRPFIESNELALIKEHDNASHGDHESHCEYRSGRTADATGFSADDQLQRGIGEGRHHEKRRRAQAEQVRQARQLPGQRQDVSS
jgi:hypothetical protein